MLRLDYSGHGGSGGAFTDGTIGGWAAEALLVAGALTEGKLVLVGSSMGGWIALLAALAMPERVAALVGIAAAPDFTEELIWAALPAPAARGAAARRRAAHAERIWRADAGDAGLIEDGRRHLLLGGEIALDCPVRLLHGQRDPDVPWETSLRLAGRLRSDDVQVVLVKDGDHRLSRAGDLALLVRTVAGLG